MAVLLLLSSAQVRGLEAPLCPASELGVSVGIPWASLQAGWLRAHLWCKEAPMQGPLPSSPPSGLYLTAKSPLGVPSESWETGSNLCPFTHTEFQHLSIGETTT